MYNLRELLTNALAEANTQKDLASQAKDVVMARRWAVLATELEKDLAYYIVNLESISLEE
jgi:hypothetical protein